MQVLLTQMTEIVCILVLKGICSQHEPIVGLGAVFVKELETQGMYHTYNSNDHILIRNTKI